MNDDVFTFKGEPHYVRPHGYDKGYTTRCETCRYFAEDEKSKSIWAHIKTGECHSIAQHTERGYIHRTKGWDKFNGIDSCKWWFPIIAPNYFG